jgi:hypothetical protein
MSFINWLLGKKKKRKSKRDPYRHYKKKRGGGARVRVSKEQRARLGKLYYEYLAKGRAHEERGEFKSASVWYAKGAALIAKISGPTSPRAKMWRARAEDMREAGRTGETTMGTLYRGRDPKRRSKRRKRSS